ncbi:MAG: lysophospholipid acyltransferase family protein [Syntrophales bacterium]|jgi:KDO2-lipid IV(A) lauroyltransferase|nr:lysophospholipid acyltransferase family protein [Syntrophales bacterium]MCK9527544.1 lysophospholipid acyltransferase family protein [Syntrophales bacterium]MDX9922601.1 lysophospholipid acyltransferase family protein [Syntrophales bacterium]
MSGTGSNPKELWADLILRSAQAVPSRMRRFVFAELSELSYHFLSRRRSVALKNLESAFPEKSKAERVAIVKRVFRNLGIVASEFFDLPRLTERNIADVVRVEGREHCRKALEKGKGVLLFGAHLGNWELEAVAFSLLLKPLTVIYRPLDSAVLDTLVFKIRSCTGNTPVSKTRSMRTMLRSLKNNEILGILIDQNVDWYEGPFVDFFGRPACTSEGVALLALHTGAPVIPAYMVREPDNRYRLVIGEEIDIVRTGDRTDDIRANTQRFTTIIEHSIRRYPDQWLWVHQRWKTTLSRVPKNR